MIYLYHDQMDCFGRLHIHHRNNPVYFLLLMIHDLRYHLDHSLCNYIHFLLILSLYSPGSKMHCIDLPQYPLYIHWLCLHRIC